MITKNDLQISEPIIKPITPNISKAVIRNIKGNSDNIYVFKSLLSKNNHTEYILEINNKTQYQCTSLIDSINKVLTIENDMERINVLEKLDKEKYMDNKIYKAMIINFNNKGDFLGKAVLCQNFSTVVDALNEANTHKCSQYDIIQVKEYDASKSNIMAFDNEKDTGTLVYRDASTAIFAMKAEFQILCNNYDDFEGTMSYYLNCLKDKSFEDLRFNEIVDYLTDEELNDLLAEYGDDEFFYYKDGKAISIDEDLDK